MSTYVEMFVSRVLNYIIEYSPTVVAYGSSFRNNVKSDIDLCFVTEKEVPYSVKEIVKSELISFSIENGLVVDQEVPYDNKLFFTVEEVDELSRYSPFEKDDGSFEVTDINKTKDYLSSKEMRHRLWINIITTEHIVLFGDYSYIEKCATAAWKKLLLAIKKTFSNIDINSEAEYIHALKENPLTGAKGEDYLGYKGNTLSKDLQLRIDIERHIEDVDCVINASENMNPFFPTPSMERHLHKCCDEAKKYPDLKNERIIEDAESVFKICKESIMFTNGSMEGIHMLIDSSEGKICVPQPAFWGYTATARVLGIHYDSVEIDEKNYFEQLKGVCREYDIVLLSQINNPYPIQLCSESIEYLAKMNPQCHFIIDETMLAFKYDYMKLSLISKVCKYDNLTIVLSVSKISGLCGLRGGFIFSSRNRISQLLLHKAAYSTNSITEAFFNKDNLYKIIWDNQYRTKIKESLDFFCNQLQNQKYVKCVMNSHSVFCLVEFEDCIDVKSLQGHLESKCIKVSYPFEVYGNKFKQIIRVSVCERYKIAYIASSIIDYLKMEGK